MIERKLQYFLEQHWHDGKVLLVLGPRQVGKTTLLEKLCSQEGEYLFLNGDDITTQKTLENIGEVGLKQLIGDYKTIFIDEAQRIQNIGLFLKIIHDRLKHVRVVVSGSSALELSSTINEPLTGRKWECQLFPISWAELSAHFGYLNSKQQFEIRLIYGMYPDVINNLGAEEGVLKQLASSYLYKDLLNYNGIRKPEVLSKLLIALALQLGSEVSYNELAQLLRIDRATVEQYIGLLEQAFVVFRLNPFSRNIRNELSSTRKIYFYDNGIRNALIGNFNPPMLRNDIGALWENFLISERIKTNQYNGSNAKGYFWRTHAQQEIDYLEEYGGEMYAYEFKWNPKAKTKFPSSFVETYAPVEKKIISTQNFEEFLIP